MQQRIDKLRAVLKAQGIDAFFSSEPMIRRYISGFTGSTGYAVISAEGLDFLTDFRYFEQVSIDAPLYSLVKLSKSFTLQDYLKEKGFSRIAIEETFMTVDVYEAIRSALPALEIVHGVSLINGVRQIKFPDEILLYRKSCEITNRVLESLFFWVRPGVTEREVYCYILQKIQEFGADGPFFDPITISGPRSSLCHGKPSERALEEGDFLLVDMGVLYQGYASDVTRTVVLGKASEKQKEIYGIVLRAHLEAAKRIRVGMSGFDADKIARDIIDGAGYGEHYQHALGHGFHDGLIMRDNHAVSDFPLAENMVFTLEPGIYLPGFGGVRIEDDYLLTASGPESFCTFTKELVELPV